MKTTAYVPVLFALTLSVAAGAAAGVAARDIPDQVATPIANPAEVGVLQAVPDVAQARQQPAQAAPPVVYVPEIQRMSVPRHWDETQATIRVPFTNSSALALDLIGVQTSGSLYVVSFPTSLPPGRSGEIVLAYSADSGTQADSDLVKLLTSQGTRAIELVQDREPVVQFEAEELAWALGDRTPTKSVKLQLAPGTAQLRGVRAYGEGNAAKLQDLGGGWYRVDVTVGSVDAPEKFPVVLDFFPTLAGVRNVILCSVSAARAAK